MKSKFYEGLKCMLIKEEGYVQVLYNETVVGEVKQNKFITFDEELEILEEDDVKIKALGTYVMYPTPIYDKKRKKEQKQRKR